MKRVFTACLVLTSTLAMAQSARVVTAGVSLKQGLLDKAWENIEEAIKDPKTGIDAKTWDYRFKILDAISESQNLEYRSLVPMQDLFPKMKESYQKVKEYDTKNKYFEDLEKKLKLDAAIVANSAIDAYTMANLVESYADTLKKYQMIDTEGLVRVGAIDKNLEVLKEKAGKPGSPVRETIVKCLEADKAAILTCLSKKSIPFYQGAIQGFTLSVAANDIIGLVDSASLFNAAICAERAGMKKEAAQLYRECTKINYGGSKVFSFAAKLQKELGNTTEQLNIIKEGRKAHPEDLDLLVAELNIYLEVANYVDSEKLLKAAIEKDPTNEIMFFVLGSTYDNLANPRDKNGAELAKPANYDELVLSAKTSYEKALALKPDYFDALYNYGALLFNEGVELNTKANALDYRTKKAQIEELNKKADAKFKASLIPFEKALTIKGDDQGLLLSLKQLYVRLEMTEKYKAIKEKLDNM